MAAIDKVARIGPNFGMDIVLFIGDVLAPSKLVQVITVNLRRPPKGYWPIDVHDKVARIGLNFGMVIVHFIGDFLAHLNFVQVI